ncbi:MAG: hypothetical protein Tsb0017_12470 [Geothermobacteraceae bacterium]
MAKTFGKDQWVELFRETGLSEEMMERWHRLFEARYPEAHQSFLEWLGLPETQVAEIRQRFAN